MTNQLETSPDLATRNLRYARAGLTTEQTMSTVLHRAVAQHADRPAVLDLTGDGLREISYARLWAEATAFAGTLRRAGVGAGDRVLIQTSNTHRALVAFWAAWHVGAVCVPVVDIYRAHEVRDILAAARPAAVVVASEHRGHGYPQMYDELFDEAGTRPTATLLLDGEAHGWTDYDRTIRGQATLEPAAVGADDPALILFTSGTTARPKGVLHSARTLLAETAQLTRSYGLSWRDRGYLALPTAHITGVLFALTLPVFSGAGVVLSRPRGLERTADELIEHRATWGAGPARLITAMVARQDGRPTPLKAFSCGGMASDPEVIQVAKDHGIPAFRTYGMTECPTVTDSTADELDHVRFETDGRIAYGVECQAVAPESREPLDPDEEGELRVRGPERMLGYLDPASTAASIDDDGWFYTGDLGVVDDQRCVRITGRIKDIINRGGEKFSALDIERALQRHPSVAEVAVVAVADSRFGEVPAAYLVADAGNSPPAEPDQLTAFLATEGLAAQKTPARFVWLPELPKTPTGKVRKAELVRGAAAAGDVLDPDTGRPRSR